MCLPGEAPIVIPEPMYREKRVGEDEVPPFTRLEGYAYAALKYHLAQRKEKIE